MESRLFASPRVKLARRLRDGVWRLHRRGVCRGAAQTGAKRRRRSRQQRWIKRARRPGADSGAAREDTDLDHDDERRRRRPGVPGGRRAGWSEGRRRRWPAGRRRGWPDGRRRGWPEGRRAGWSARRRRSWPEGRRRGWSRRTTASRVSPTMASRARTTTARRTSRTAASRVSRTAASRVSRTAASRASRTAASRVRTKARAGLRRRAGSVCGAALIALTSAVCDRASEDFGTLGSRSIEAGRVDRKGVVLGETFPQVLAAAREGADWAWARLYRDIAPSVLGYLRARRAAEPDDLTGEVFLQVVRDLHRFEGGERDFRAWVFAIAHHRLIDDARRRARRPVEPAGEVTEWQAPDEEVGEEVARAFAAERVRRLIGELAPEQRDVSSAPRPRGADRLGGCEGDGEERRSGESPSASRARADQTDIVRGRRTHLSYGGAHEDEMGRLLRLHDRDLDRLLAGRAPADNGDLDELAAFVRELTHTFQAAPDPATETRHLNAIMNAVRALPAADPTPIEATNGSPSPVRWRRRLRGRLWAVRLVLAGVLAFGLFCGGRSTPARCPARFKVPSPISPGTSVSPCRARTTTRTTALRTTSKMVSRTSSRGTRRRTPTARPRPTAPRTDGAPP